MTPEEVEKLKPRDCLDGISPIDPILIRLGHQYKGEVIRRTEHGVIIRRDDPEDPQDGDLYSFSDRRLAPLLITVQGNLADRRGWKRTENDSPLSAQKLSAVAPPRGEGEDE
jgi:hypothetical protein